MRSPYRLTPRSVHVYGSSSASQPVSEGWREVLAVALRKKTRVYVLVPSLSERLLVMKRRVLGSWIVVFKSVHGMGVLVDDR